MSYIQFLEIRIQNKPKLKLENVNIFSILTLESENRRIYFHVLCFDYTMLIYFNVLILELVY